MVSSQPMQSFPTRDWQAANRTGGLLDDVLDELRSRHPDLWVERLEKTHPGDDVYFLGMTDLRYVVQVDTSANGQPPFTVEADDRIDTSDPAEAIAALEARLKPKL